MERLFTIPLVIIYYGVGFWGFFLIEQYLYNEFGLLVTILAIFVLPIGYIFTPLYAGFTDGYWLPAMVAYSPIILYMSIFMLTSLYEAVTRRS
jgi:hypothetical protein